MALKSVKVGDTVVVDLCPCASRSSHEGRSAVVTAIDEHGWVEVRMDGGDFCEPLDFVDAPK